MHLKENNTENNAKVSVVVPIYNVEKYLHRCVDSLLTQDYEPLEIILVDDGSPDNSGLICDEYATAHSNISVIHKQNGGLSSARRVGWEAATGDLIAFVDSDDYVARNYVSKLASPFADSPVQLSICGYATQKDGVITPSALPYSGGFIENEKIAESYILPIIGALTHQDAMNIPGFVPIRMYRRDLLQAKDFVSEREYFTEDVVMNVLYGRRVTGRIAVVNEPLYYYCVNPGSLTLKYRENAFGMLMACNDLCDKLTADLDVEPMDVATRLEANLVSTVTYSIYNMGRISTYKRFKSELKEVFNHPKVKTLFQSGKWPQKATWHKIISIAYQTKAYFILYLLLKTRKVL